MILCRDCEHWGTQFTGRHSDLDYNECHLVDTLESPMYLDSSQYEDEMASMVNLVTHKLFGCVAGKYLKGELPELI